MSARVRGLGHARHGELRLVEKLRRLFGRSCRRCFWRSALRFSRFCECENKVNLGRFVLYDVHRSDDCIDVSGHLCTQGVRARSKLLKPIAPFRIRVSSLGWLGVCLLESSAF